MTTNREEPFTLTELEEARGHHRLGIEQMAHFIRWRKQDQASLLSAQETVERLEGENAELQRDRSGLMQVVVSVRAERDTALATVERLEARLIKQDELTASLDNCLAWAKEWKPKCEAALVSAEAAGKRVEAAEELSTAATVLWAFLGTTLSPEIVELRKTLKISIDAFEDTLTPPPQSGTAPKWAQESAAALEVWGKSGTGRAVDMEAGYCVRCNGGDAFSKCTCPQPRTAKSGG